MKNIPILLHHGIQQTTPQTLPDKIYEIKKKESLRIHSVVWK